jgi:hypothetical protein
MNFRNLFDNYLKNVPTLGYVLQKHLNNYQIDHIAHRSLNYFDILKYYQNKKYKLQKDEYLFKDMNVKAMWLKNNSLIIPRVFISQYVGDLPNNLTINSKKDYENIYNHSQYLAWTLIHGNAINHIALTHNNIEQLFDNIKRDPELSLATDLQYSKDNKLIQFSLQADKIKHKFGNGDEELLPGYFVEFIQRLDNRDGFEVSNASKIFNSTN